VHPGPTGAHSGEASEYRTPPFRRPGRAPRRGALVPPGEAGPPPGAPGLLRAESRGARAQPPLAAEVTKIKPTKQVDLIELLAHHGAMLTSDIHRPVRDADAALPHRDEERLLGVIPLTDRRKVMVVV